MRPEDITRFVHARPFRAFRIHLTDGAEFDICHPELVMVGRSTVVIGISTGDGSEPVFDRLVHCDLAHITRAEAIDEVAAN